MGLHNRLGQEVDDGRMDFLAYQYDVGRRNQMDVRHRNFSLQINGAARQHQMHKIRKDAA